jgi:hypothetical protein
MVAARAARTVRIVRTVRMVRAVKRKWMTLKLGAAVRFKEQFNNCRR